MSTFDEILKEKLQAKVPVKGKDEMIDPMEAMVNALMMNAMKGDIASIAFIRNMTQDTDPEKEKEAIEKHKETAIEFAIDLRRQLEDEGAYDGQDVEIAMLAETAVMVDELTRRIASSDFEPVMTDPRTGKQTISPLIQLRDSQRELFDKQFAKLRQEAINRKIMKKQMGL